jgi:6-phosphogluconate dehydrogenase
MDNEEMSKALYRVEQVKFEFLLIEITATILAKKDDLNDEGYRGQDSRQDWYDGTGRWTVQKAEQSVAAPLIATSLDARYMSGQ